MQLKRLQKHQNKSSWTCKTQNCYRSWGKTRGFQHFYFPFSISSDWYRLCTDVLPAVCRRSGPSLLLPLLHSEPPHLAPVLLGLLVFRTPTAVPVLFQQQATEAGFLLTWSQVGHITLYLKEFIFVQVLCKPVPRRTCQKGWETLSHLPFAVQTVRI